MNVQTDKTVRRKRKPVSRRVPVVPEQRQKKPFAFGWGHDLNHRERESLKERIALFGGIALAACLALLLGWGWYQDNVYKPGQIQEQNNRAVAKIGSYVVRMGYFNRFEHFRKTQMNNQLTQIQQQITALQADTKHAKQNALNLAQLQQQQSGLQTQLASLSSNTLTSIIDNQTILQRSKDAGVVATPKDVSNAMTQLEHQAGGRVHFQQFIQQSGLSSNEIKALLTADLLRGKLQTKLASKVNHVQLKVRASHILIPNNQKALANSLYHQVLAGANVAPLAKKYSKDPGSAAKGGDLGYFSRGTMVPAFDKAAFSMKVGDVRLVQSSYGWHIIKVTGEKRSRLSPAEYSQAQASALQSWLTTEQASLGLQRFSVPK